MNTTMTIDEIFENYPDEWILLDELQSQDNLSVQGGRVVGHDAARSVVEHLAIEQGLERCAMVCTKKGSDGEYTVEREYAVSPITSSTEIQEYMAAAE